MLGSVPEQQQTRRGLALLAAERKAKARRLSAAAIVNKHVLARGGLEAWRGVQTLSLSGKMDAGTGDSVARSMRVGAGTKKRRREIAAAGPQEEPEKEVQLPFKVARQGHNQARLKLTARTGSVQRVWIDAQSFLDIQVEGVPRRMDGKMHSVWIHQRDFRSVQGLKIPFIVETIVDGYPQAHQIVVDKVAVNPKLD